VDSASRPARSDDAANKVRAVLLLGAIPNQHNFLRMGVPRLREEFDLHILDLNQLLGREKASQGNAASFAVTPIASLKQLEETLSQLKPSFALDFVGIDARAYLGICKSLEKTGTDLVVVKDGPIPTAGIFNTLVCLAYQRLKPTPKTKDGPESEASSASAIPGQSGVLDKIATVAWALFQKRIEIIGVFAGSRSYDINSRFVSHKLWAASEDVHTFHALANQEISGLSRGKIVFLDSPIADGSDWVALGRQPLVSADDYYPQMRKVFSEIEKAAGKEIVIAGHPNHKDQVDFAQAMGGRDVVFNSTAQLIRDSVLVISHGSTAISFAVLARKPLVFLNSKELSASAYGTMMAKMAKILNREIVYIDSDLKNLKPALQVSVEPRAYEKYEDGYLQAQGTTESRQWDAFIEFAREKYRVQQ
jgi:hypothetical protein